jgi:hypothetical protein
MTHESIVKALKDLNAEGWILEGDKIENIVWTTDNVKTEAEILAAIANPLPEQELSVSAKLSSVGLSIDDLKVALGL